MSVEVIRKDSVNEMWSGIIYMECEYKPTLPNENKLYNQSTPFPFGPGPQSPSNHARTLPGISTINAMRDTCLAAKGYRIE